MNEKLLEAIENQNWAHQQEETGEITLIRGTVWTDDQDINFATNDVHLVFGQVIDFIEFYAAFVEDQEVDYLDYGAELAPDSVPARKETKLFRVSIGNATTTRVAIFQTDDVDTLLTRLMTEHAAGLKWVRYLAPDGTWLLFDRDVHESLSAAAADENTVFLYAEEVKLGKWQEAVMN